MTFNAMQVNKKANALRTLKNDNAADVNGVVGQMLRYECGFLMGQLCDFMDVYVKTVAVPENQKNAVVAPLYKENGNKNQCKTTQRLVC